MKNFVISLMYFFLFLSACKPGLILNRGDLKFNMDCGWDLSVEDRSELSRTWKDILSEIYPEQEMSINDVCVFFDENIFVTYRVENDKKNNQRAVILSSDKQILNEVSFQCSSPGMLVSSRVSEEQTTDDLHLDCYGSDSTWLYKENFYLDLNDFTITAGEMEKYRETDCCGEDE